MWVTEQFKVGKGQETPTIQIQTELSERIGVEEMIGVEMISCL